MEEQQKQQQQRGKIIKEIIKVVNESNWASKAVVTEVMEEQFPEPAYAFPISYAIRGHFTTREAVAYACWSPERVQEAVADIQDKYDEEEFQITSYLDFMIEANYAIKVHSFLGDSPSREPLFVQNVPNLIICFTSFDAETAPILQAMELPLEGSMIRITGLLLDEEKPTRAVKQFVSKLIANRFPCFWVGPNGWASEAAQLLCVEESAPSAFLFDSAGFCECSGSVEDCVQFYEAKVAMDGSSSSGVCVRDDQDFEEDEPSVTKTRATAVVSAVADKEAWDSVKAAVAEFNLGAKWKTTRTVFPIALASTTSVIQISGPVYIELLEKFQASSLVKFDCHRVQFVTRPKPAKLEKQCRCGNGAVSKYHCLVCDVSLCTDCAKQHEKTDPLIILGHGDLSRAIFGVGHVHKDLEAASETEGGSHPDIGCDCCLAALANDAPRFKNLAKVEHDLCQGCFLALIKASNLGSNATSESEHEEDINDRFNCHPKDPFCEVKSSRGVSFNRSAVPPPPCAATACVTPEQMHAPGARVAHRHGGGSGSGRHSRVPHGHTEFSWFPSVPLGPMGKTSGITPPPPHGHTHFSWGGSDSSRF